TIFNLIERFYEPNSGKIKIGNKLIKDYNLMEWRKAFGYVSQDNLHPPSPTSVSKPFLKVVINPRAKAASAALIISSSLTFLSI
ncbi:ATP-binding cassette domain-containing protein, partial [Clostridium botulinum]|nr:ATP-binding cassette domain-containing protein [Clostridium botulinum]